MRGLSVLVPQDGIDELGRDPRPLLRFPFGDRDARTKRIAADLGYRFVTVASYAR